MDDSGKPTKVISPYAAYIICDVPARTKHEGKTDQIVMQRRQIFVRHEYDLEGVQDKLFNRGFVPKKLVGFEDRPELNGIAAVVDAAMNGAKKDQLIDKQRAEIERLRSEKSGKGKSSAGEGADSKRPGATA